MAAAPPAATLPDFALALADAQKLLATAVECDSQADALDQFGHCLELLAPLTGSTHSDMAEPSSKRRRTTDTETTEAEAMEYMRMCARELAATANLEFGKRLLEQQPQTAEARLNRALELKQDYADAHLQVVVGPLGGCRLNVPHALFVQLATLARRRGELAQTENHLRDALAAGVSCLSSGVKDGNEQQLAAALAAQYDLALLLCQQSNRPAQEEAHAHLSAMGFRWRLSPPVLAHPTRQAASLSQASEPPVVVIDNVLPSKLLQHLQAGFSKSAQFWGDHDYPTPEFFR